MARRAARGNELPRVRVQLLAGPGLSIQNFLTQWVSRAGHFSADPHPRYQNMKYLPLFFREAQTGSNKQPWGSFSAPPSNAWTNVAQFRKKKNACSFSAAPKPIFAVEDSLCSMFKHLQDLRLFAPLDSTPY